MRTDIEFELVTINFEEYIGFLIIENWMDESLIKVENEKLLICVWINEELLLG